jgi:hypothetical protein
MLPLQQQQRVRCYTQIQQELLAWFLEAARNRGRSWDDLAPETQDSMANRRPKLRVATPGLLPIADAETDVPDNMAKILDDLINLRRMVNAYHAGQLDGADLSHKPTSRANITPMN